MKTDKLLANLKQFQEANLNYNFAYFSINYETLEILTVKDGIDNLLNKKNRIIFAFMDPNTQNKYASWPLRNYLTLLSYYW